jgi:hypothetical protein
MWLEQVLFSPNSRSRNCQLELTMKYFTACTELPPTRPDGMAEYYSTRMT